MTHGGADLVIDRLVALPGIEMAGVFIESKPTPRRSMIEKMKRSIRYDGVAATAVKFIRRSDPSNSDAASIDLTRSAAASNGIEVTEVDDYHGDGSIEQLNAANADLGVIYGTNIIKESVFSIPKLGSINLHQGLAPFYRGGPPVFWELFNGENEVGLTVHFVAAKVDTGDIVRQTKIPLRYDFSFGKDFEAFIDNYRNGLREASANLVAEAVDMIASGQFDRRPQDITLGRRYRLPTKKEKNELVRRLKQRPTEGGDE